MAEHEGGMMAEGERNVAGAQAAREAGANGKQRTVTAHRGFYPIVYGDKVEVSRGGGMVFVAKDEIEIEQGGGQWMIGLRKLELERGGCGVMVAGRAEVSRGFIGVLLTPRAELKDSSRVLMTFGQALAAGAAAGALVGLSFWLTGRRGAGRATASTETRP